MSFPRFNKHWFLVLLWMTVIFAASTGLGAPRNTSRILGPFLHWLIPSLSNETINTIIFYIRKSGHAIEYAVLGLLVWRAQRYSKTPAPKEWLPLEAVVAIVVSALYAVSDEFHQHFVSSRQASAIDVAIDTCGAAFAMLLVWGAGRWCKRW